MRLVTLKSGGSVLGDNAPPPRSVIRAWPSRSAAAQFTAPVRARRAAGGSEAGVGVERR